MRNDITQERLKQVVNYSPETGMFTRLVATSTCVKVGGIVGHYDNNGYLKCSIDMAEYRMHRLAFLYTEGFFPEHDVDHINGIRDDNRWCNLRHATRACNMQNKRVYSSNKSGFPGVSWCKGRGKWRSDCKLKGKTVYLGCHSTTIEAALARLTFETQCDKWECNDRNGLVEAIKLSWPSFNSSHIAFL